MPPTPRVSIVLATYNQAAWLARTIASVRAQTYQDWELLIADDGSTDDTAAVVAQVAGDARVRHLPGPRRERCVARNRAIAAARGELIAFLDGDDRWHPSKLARQVTSLDIDPTASWCATVARFIDADDRPLPIRKPPRPIDGEVFSRLMRANCLILASVVVRRAMLDSVGGFDETLPVLGCEDWDLWLRVARRAPLRMLGDELTYYRRHPDNTTNESLLASGLAVIDQQYRDPETARAAKLSRASARARLLWHHANAATERSRRSAAALCWRAFREAPQHSWSRPAAGAIARLCTPVFIHTVLSRQRPQPTSCISP